MLNKMHASLFLVITLAFLNCKTTQKNSDLVLGNQYAKDGLFREAAEAYRASIRNDPKNMTAYRNLGMVLVKLKDFKKAIQSLETSINAYDNDFDANFYLAEAFRGNEQYSEAIFRYQKSLKIKPKSLKTKKSLAWSYFKIRYYSEALKVAQQAYKQNTKDVQTNVILGRIYLSLGRIDGVKMAIKRMRKYSSKDSMAHVDSIEGELYYKMNDCKRAIPLYQKALKSQPLLSSALLGLGGCMNKSKKFDVAVKLLQRAVRISPNLKGAYLALGQAYEGLGDKRALKYYKSYINLAKNDPEHLAQLEGIRRKVAKLK